MRRLVSLCVLATVLAFTQSVWAVGLLDKNLATGELRTVCPEIGEYRAEFGIDGNTIAYTVHTSGTTGSVYTYDLATRQNTLVANEAGGIFSVHGGAVAYNTIDWKVRLWENGTLTTLADRGLNPVIGPGYIAWGNFDNTMSLMNRTTGTVEILPQQSITFIDNSKMTWISWPVGGTTATVQQMDLTTRETQTIGTLTRGSSDYFAVAPTFLGYIHNNEVHTIDYATWTDTTISLPGPNDVQQSLLQTDGTSLVWCDLSEGEARFDDEGNYLGNDRAVKVMYYGPRGLLEISADSGATDNIFAAVSGDHVVYDPRGTVATPEPSSAVLAAVALAIAAVWHSRRKR